MRKALAVYRKELRQILRDRRTLLILVFIPALFLLLYGYALNFDIRHIALAVDDRDSSAQSRSLVSAFVNSGYFDLVASTHAPDEIERLVNLNRARAVLVIPEGFGRDLSSGLLTPVQVIIDGDNANTATTVLGYASNLLRTVGAELSPATVVRPSPLSPLTVEPRIWYNPELRSTLFLVPGLIAYIGMITAVASTALSIVREKESGTMEQIRMAPIDTFSFILGKTLPYFLISLSSSALIILASMVLFGLPMRGNWLALLLAVSLFLVGALGTGLLISTVADSQQVAFQMALLISLLPTIMLSGFIFPISGMPAFLQAVTYVVPARYFLVALRGIVLKGAEVSHLTVPLLALTAYALAMLGLSSLRLSRGACLMQRLRCLVRKEFIELRMNPRLLRLVIIAPILQLTMLGYAATTDVKNVPLIVADGDRSAASRELVARFEASPYFTVIGTVTTVNEIESDLERGTASLALSIPAGYGASVRAGRPVTVQVVADGTDSNSTTVALGYATSLIGGYAQELAASKIHDSQPDPSGPGGIDARIRVWFNPQLESRHFMIPGVLALILLIVTANLAAMAIVREKELGTLEQLNVTPLRRWELIVGKLLPYGLIALVDVVLVVAVAVLWFEVPLRGSFALLFAISLLYVLSTLALGLFISTISDTQQQAMMTATFFFLTPMIYLSGFIFPIENMPAVIQPFTYLIPLRYFLVIVRGIFLKGIGLDLLWPQVAALAAWGVAMLALAVARSRKIAR